MRKGLQSMVTFCTALLLAGTVATAAAGEPAAPGSSTADTVPTGTGGNTAVLPSCKQVAEKKKSAFGAILGRVASAAVDQVAGKATSQVGGLSGVAASEAVNQARQSDCVP